MGGRGGALQRLSELPGCGESHWNEKVHLWPPCVSNGPLVLTEGFARRKKTSLWFVGSLLLVSILILTIGLAATTRTENVTVGGYYPGIIVSPGRGRVDRVLCDSTWLTESTYLLGLETTIGFVLSRIIDPSHVHVLIPRT
jgi:hypothetical protein